MTVYFTKKFAARQLALLLPSKGCVKMKKILVFGATIKLSPEKQNGIMKKVFAQAKAFESCFDVYIWGFDENEIIYVHNGKVTVADHFKNNLERRIKYFKALTCFTLKKNAAAFYFRYASTDFCLLKALRRLKKQGILSVIEIPSYPYKGEFMHGLKKRMIYLLDSLLRGRLKKYVSRVVIFVEKPESIYGISCINTMNGIDTTESTAIHSVPGDTLNMIAVASMLPHHGFDRMIEGIHCYYSEHSDDIKIVFHVLGNGPELHAYEELVKKYKLGDRVIFYGQKSGRELDDIFEKADIAVGSLGLHRIGLREGSTLKNREYAVRGLPIVYSTYELFLKDSPYALELESDDSPADIEKILKFWNRIKNVDGLHDIIRRDAVSKCDMNVTMAPVVQYLQNNIKQGN